MLRLQLQMHSTKRLQREMDLPEAVENKSDGATQMPADYDWVSRRPSSVYCGVIAVGVTNLEDED